MGADGRFGSGHGQGLLVVSGDRREAEARLAEAKAQLAAAEQAYREVVPCEHPSITMTHDEKFSCGECGVPAPDPRGCRHHRIDDVTEQCIACGETMIDHQKHERKVLSAPNKAACTNPGCTGIDDPNCTNPEGIYIPDTVRQREVVVEMHYTYECARCRYGGSVFISGEAPIWECGRDHRGDSTPIRDGVPA